MNNDLERVLRFAIVAAVLYFGIVEVFLLIPAHLPVGVKRLSSSDTIALAGGVLTAAGLSALYLQLVTASRAAQDAAKREAERQATASLRFDELHMAFNSPEMRVSRTLGWFYAKDVAADATLRNRFARWWVLNDGLAPAPPADILARADLEYLAPVHRADYGWHISNAIAFFVRIENRLSAHYHSLPADPEVLLTSLGPFFWKSWEGPLLTLAKECDAVFEQEKGSREIERAYFSKPLSRLALRFTAFNPVSPPQVDTEPSLEPAVVQKIGAVAASGASAAPMQEEAPVVAPAAKATGTISAPATKL